MKVNHFHLIIISILIMICTGCGKTVNISVPQKNPVSQKMDVPKYTPLEQRLLDESAEPDDEWDRYYAADHMSSDTIGFVYARDNKAYDKLWGEVKISLDDIWASCQANQEIAPVYKEFIYAYASRWLELYPESDLRVLYHNLKTLKIVEASEGELVNITLTLDAPACYVSAENTIYVRKNTDYSPGTNGYIILTHELTHASRSARYQDAQDRDVVIKYYTEYDYGCYVEEALITLFAYELQGMGDEGNRFYMLPYNYFKIILDCIDYDGADYMNHSIHYLADTMDNYMQEEGNAMYMLLYFNSESMRHYESYASTDYDETDYAKFHEYLLRMYMKKFATPSMTEAELEEVYQTFVSKVLANFELSQSEQAVNETILQKAWESYLTQKLVDPTFEKLQKKRSELEQTSLDFFTPADDEYDSKYAKDYIWHHLIKVVETGDVKGYDQVYGTNEVTLEDIRQTLNQNTFISAYFKELIWNYVLRWEELYPGSDYRIFNQNLKSLKVIETTKDEIMIKTMASDAVACYLREQNEIYVRKGTDFSKETEGYIVLTHELTHVLRSANYENEEGIEVRINYYPDYFFGTFTEEALITVLAYELRGIGDQGNTFYLLPYNYLAVILDCIDYNGADYVNHNITVLADAMDAFMEEDGNAIRMLLFHEAEGNAYYCDYIDNPFTKADYEEFHEYITRMYMKKYLTDDMSAKQAEEVYLNFIHKILNNFDLVKSYQGVDEPELRIYFEKICAERKITL